MVVGYGQGALRKKAMPYCGGREDNNRHIALSMNYWLRNHKTKHWIIYAVNPPVSILIILKMCRLERTPCEGWVRVL